MNTKTQVLNPDLGTLADDARALVAATTDAAGEKVRAARSRLGSALDQIKNVAGRVSDKAAEGARSADEVVRGNPYTVIGLVLGAGALLGYLAARQCLRDSD